MHLTIYVIFPVWSPGTQININPDVLMAKHKRQQGDNGREDCVVSATSYLASITSSFRYKICIGMGTGIGM